MATRLSEAVQELKTELVTAYQDEAILAAPASLKPAGRKDECPDCGDTGFYLKRVPYGHPDFGKLQECLTCGLAARRRMEALAGASRWEADMDGWTFENLKELPTKAATLQLMRAKGKAMAWAAEPYGFLVLTGTWGDGKSHVMAAILLAQPPARPWLYTNADRLWDFLGCKRDPDSETDYSYLTELAANVPLLGVDELGAERWTDAVRDRRHRIFSHRYQAHLPTVIACNVPPDKLYAEQPWGWMEGWLRSRLLDIANVVIEMPDVDYRQVKLGQR